jgi:4-oxalomesaconate tautomerase
VGHDIAGLLDGDDTAVEHPSGTFASRVRVTQDESGAWRATSFSLRTARKLFDGTVFPGPRRSTPSAGR